MANRAWMSFGKSYSNHSSPAQVDFQFQVTPTNGAGITNLKSNGYIKNVWMHTSTTPTTGNPNPANGYILVQMSDNYAKFVNAHFHTSPPVTGGALNVDLIDAALTVGVAYQIVTLGTTTSAQWTTLGVPAGITPAVGMVFIATAVGLGTGNGTVKAIGNSGISRIDSLGNVQLELGPQGVSNQGGWLMFQCLAPSFTGSTLGTHTHTVTPTGTNDGSTPPIFTGDVDTTSATSGGTPAGTMSQVIAAPTTGTTIYGSLMFDMSSVTVDGE